MVVAGSSLTFVAKDISANHVLNNKEPGQVEESIPKEVSELSYFKQRQLCLEISQSPLGAEVDIYDMLRA